MSASNWGMCPGCCLVGEQIRQAAAARARGAYGQVSAEEYERLRRLALDDKKPEATLREDYEIGTNTHGQFYVRYGASCEACGFKYTYNHTEATQVAQPAATSGKEAPD